ncbi:MAG: hypothetical protein HWN65_06765 [Candidatus Helarchaeota archaeon]|nr:hypothetical protein [Candidatus Helarchaeota archaeon]
MVELSPKLFVELTLEMLPKVITKLTETLEENKEKLRKASNPQDTMQILYEIILEFRNEIGAELLPEGITGVDMEAYTVDYEAEIKEYVESNPEIKEKWHVLETEFKEKFQQMVA